MKKEFALAIAAVAISALLFSCTGKSEMQKLNETAQKEYLEPIRPGGVNGSPFWNVYSCRFIYAPAFDFPESEGAAEYLFSIYPASDTTELLAQFKAEKPVADLSPIWNDIAPGEVKLKVEALNADGAVIGEVGNRDFIRDFPFCGPYPQAARDYRESALKALIYVHNLPAVRAWREGTGPDLSYPMHSYVCKIIGATVRIECLLAKELDYLHDEAMETARAAAAYLVENGKGAGEALEGWPPTYGKRPLFNTSEVGNFVDNVMLNSNGRTMTAEASEVGEAYLDMFDATSDSIWFQRSLRIARTYATIQRADGSWPVKLFYENGEEACRTGIFPTSILRYFRRLNKDYGIDEFEEARSRAEKYMSDVILPLFDMTGQFEDNMSDWTDPYSNLTNITASQYADYLLNNENPSDEDVRNARDMIRFSEDQFVHWDCFPEDNGFKRTFCPCVHEQRAYEEAIDASAISVANGYMALYDYCSDPLALAKAQALMNSVTRTQNSVTGRINTVMAYNGGYDESVEDIWFNCSLRAALALMRMDETAKRAGIGNSGK